MTVNDGGKSILFLVRQRLNKTTFPAKAVIEMIVNKTEKINMYQLGQKAILAILNT